MTGLSAEEVAREKKLALMYSGHVQPAQLWRPLKNLPQKNVVKCELCAHYCIINDGDVGACLVRKNKRGKLVSLNWGKAESLAIDPIEKKPFFHFKPGSNVLSFGTPGCNFRCLNCQNWSLSQAVKQFGAQSLQTLIVKPETIAGRAVGEKVDGIAYTYSEPTIFFEYAYDTIMECRKRQKREGQKSGQLAKDFFHVFVSNGYFSREMLDLVVRKKLLAAIRIDLKFMDDDKYLRICGGRLKPVLDSIKRVAALRNNAGWPIHLEVINLVIPGQNDSDEDLRAVSEYVAGLSPDIPLHFSRFFPNFKMENVPPTALERLIRAKEIAKKAGLNYVYIGNADVPAGEDTNCPKCGELLISRNRFGVEKNVFAAKKFAGLRGPPCPKCGEKINLVL